MASHDHHHDHDHDHDHHVHHDHHHDGDSKSESWVGPDGRVYHSHDGLAPHSHEPIYSPGFFSKRAQPLLTRDFNERAFTVGIGGPVGTGWVTQSILCSPHFFSFWISIVILFLLWLVISLHSSIKNLVYWLLDVKALHMKGYFLGFILFDLASCLCKSRTFQ